MSLLENNNATTVPLAANTIKAKLIDIIRKQ